MPERQPIWLNCMARRSSVDDELFASTTGSAIQEDLQRDESASRRRVSTTTQQPHPFAEALGLDRWRSGTLLW